MRWMYIPLHEALQLYDVFPELMVAVGQSGFSVTGGLAQTSSVRTDNVEYRAAKLAATLIDEIEFAQTTDVLAWFKRNQRHLARAIFGGVGGGGNTALAEPGRTRETTQEMTIDSDTAKPETKPNCPSLFSRILIARPK